MSARRERETIDVQAERAVVAAVRVPESRYDPADPFGELRALAEQAGAVVVGELSQRLERPVAGTYMGVGKIEELKGLCERLDASVILFDHDLSPKQISKIEEMTGRKVLDRSELILDIFAGRATTHEAKLQVELAQLEYTYPRLRAMWDHLERIVGGSPGGVGTRGPGEQQLEIDRRLVQKRKLALQAELREIQARKRREVRARNVDHFTVGIVGYTNAGKSTLFNTLTAGGAYADNRLFATLMTRTREWDLGGGLRVMLSDTVGFVRDLPHNLIASFRATLEEATHADLLLIVLDISDPAAELHLKTVHETLDAIFEEVRHAEKRLKDGAQPAPEPRRVLLLNKVDQLKDNAELLVWTHKHPDAIPISALPATDRWPSPSGAGAAPLRLGGQALADLVRDAARGEVRELAITVPLSDSKTIHTIENRAEVLDRSYADGTVTLTARIGLRQLDQLRSAGARMAVQGELAQTPRQGWGRRE
ncbi:MAG TPA: GTPase HflX [Phycisphaerales bacterium]|nr:GTPase HflX [Phycisphaerales bacterium]